MYAIYTSTNSSTTEHPYTTRRLQPAHLVSCIIRGGTANINFIYLIG